MTETATTTPHRTGVAAEHAEVMRRLAVGDSVRTIAAGEHLTFDEVREIAASYGWTDPHDGTMRPPRKSIAAAPTDSSVVLLEDLGITRRGEDVAWQDDALCAQTDPEAFFPEKGGSTREVKKVCRACEVRAECLEYALEHDERFGIWGGLSERERRRLKRQAI